MTATVKQGRGWCELSECGDRIKPQDVTIIVGETGEEVVVCSPCLVSLGGGVPADDMEIEEMKVADLDRRLDEALERVEALRREVVQRGRGTANGS